MAEPSDYFDFGHDDSTSNLGQDEVHSSHEYAATDPITSRKRSKTSDVQTLCFDEVTTKVAAGNTAKRRYCKELYSCKSTGGTGHIRRHMNTCVPKYVGTDSVGGGTRLNFPEALLQVVQEFGITMPVMLDFNL